MSSPVAPPSAGPLPASHPVRFSPWLVVQLKPNQLARAQANFTRQGIETFMPQVMEGVRRNGRLLRVARPLFPGYLFVKPAPDLPASVLNSTYGVLRLIMRSADTPQPVPWEVMDWLQAHTGADGIFALGADVQLGDEVRLTGGPWAGHVAEVDRQSAPERASVLLSMMGQAVRMEISTRDVVVIAR